MISSSLFLCLFFFVSFSTCSLLWPEMKTLQQLIQGLQNLPDGAGPDFAAFAAAAAAAENKASSSSSSSTLPATSAASAAKSSSSASAAATPAVSLEQSLEQMMQAVSQGAKSAGAAVRLDFVCYVLIYFCHSCLCLGLAFELLVVHFIVFIAMRVIYFAPSAAVQCPAQLG